MHLSGFFRSVMLNGQNHSIKFHLFDNKLKIFLHKGTPLLEHLMYKTHHNLLSECLVSTPQPTLPHQLRQ